ncbi:MAG TPA: hypothetical protein VMX16_03965 [Terriglobia bacterium]|nr:hypothetical protein [Terriglobia bacterium]
MQPELCYDARLPDKAKFVVIVFLVRECAGGRSFMGENLSKLSPVTYGLAVICFFLPFVTFSCQGQRVASISGIELATGSSVQQPQMFGPAQTRREPPNSWAVLALLCAVAGTAFGFILKKRGGVALSALAGVGGLLSLVALKSQIDNEVLTQSGGMIQVNYGLGFYLVLILFLTALGLNGYWVARARGSPASPVNGAGKPGDRFCTQCGSRNAAADLFCKECGTKFA